MAVSEHVGDEEANSVVVRHLSYTFPGGEAFMDDFNLDVPLGARCLLLGCNGAGATETTSKQMALLLHRTLGGRLHMCDVQADTRV